MSNVDINVDRRTDGQTDGQKIGRLYLILLQAGAIKRKKQPKETLIFKLSGIQCVCVHRLLLTEILRVYT